MADWDYGDAWDRFPIKPGEIWAVGDHRFGCCDIEAGQVDQFLEIVGTPDVAYTDPPWGAALATGFRTKAKMNRKVNFSDFLAAMFRTLALVKGDIVWEMGIQWNEESRQAAAAAGLLVAGDPVGIVYGHKQPARLNLGTRRPPILAPSILGKCAGAHDRDTPHLAVAEWCKTISHRFTVFDPCIGLGTTAIATITRGQIVVGTELHPRRLANTIAEAVNIENAPARKVAEV